MRGLNDDYHGVGGPWKVSDLEHICEPLARLRPGGPRGIGLPHNGDFNGRSQRGCGRLSGDDAQRSACSAVDAFLRPAMARAGWT